jgi:Uma2 family endonuclease
MIHVAVARAKVLTKPLAACHGPRRQWRGTIVAMGANPGLVTFEEFERMPETDVPFKEELLDGELIQMPLAFLRHTRMAHRLHHLLSPMLHASNRPANLGEVYMVMGYKIVSNTWLVPDVSILHARQDRGDYLEGAPALAVEIVGESNTAAWVERKVKKYLSSGGVEVWVVHPDTRSVRVFREGSSEEFRGKLRSEIIPGLTIDLDNLFSARPD